MVCITILRRAANSRLAASVFLNIPKLAVRSKYNGLHLRLITMDTDNTSASTLKRPLEDNEEDTSSSMKVAKLDDTGVAKPGAQESASAEAAGSTKDDARRKGKNSRVPVPRRQAREARQGTDMRRGTRPEGETRREGEGDEARGPRLPKRQCALLLGFCGSGYSGMQLYVPDLLVFR